MASALDSPSSIRKVLPTADRAGPARRRPPNKNPPTPAPAIHPAHHTRTESIIYRATPIGPFPPAGAAGPVAPFDTLKYRLPIPSPCGILSKATQAMV